MDWKTLFVRKVPNLTRVFSGCSGDFSPESSGALFCFVFWGGGCCFCFFPEMNTSGSHLFLRVMLQNEFDVVLGFGDHSLW